MFRPRGTGRSSPNTTPEHYQIRCRFWWACRDHVEQAPGIGLELTNWRGVNKTIIPSEDGHIVREPTPSALIGRVGEAAAVIRVVAPRVGRPRARPASVFPLGLSGQAVVPAFLTTEPGRKPWNRSSLCSPRGDRRSAQTPHCARIRLLGVSHTMSVRRRGQIPASRRQF